jgi:hypothetical protein
MSDKKCAQCKLFKTFEEFSVDKQKATGISSYCKVCMSEKNKAKYLRGRSLKNKTRNGLSQSNPSEYWKQWKTENPEKVKIAQQLWQRRNKDKVAAKNFQRYARKKKRVPPWINLAMKLEIDGFYTFCKIFSDYEVDHIVPIAGEEISGLHVPWNLQVLNSKINAQKSNTFNPAMYPQQGTCAYLEKT